MAFPALGKIRLALVAALAATMLTGTDVHAAKVALVIGNSDYRSVPRLPSPLNDALDVAASFERLGFAVTRVNDATFDAMRRALLTFGRAARGAEIAVVFFAGHGIEVAAENWLIPTDAELKSDGDVDHEAIALKGVMTTVESAGRLGLVILDACRNNPFAARLTRSNRIRSVGHGLAQVEPTGNVLVAYAAKDGTLAADGNARNSPFTAALLTHIETPGLEINFLFRNVRDDVVKATNRTQQPYVYGSLSKDAIYLNQAPTPPAAQIVAPEGHSPDQITWGLLKDSKDPAALRRFIEQFPTSPLVAQVEARLATLATEQAGAPEAGSRPVPAISRSRAADFELAYWDTIKASTAVGEFESYLALYPAGVFAPLAKLRIEELKREHAKPATKALPPSAPASVEKKKKVRSAAREPAAKPALTRSISPAAPVADGHGRIGPLRGTGVGRRCQSGDAQACALLRARCAEGGARACQFVGGGGR